MDREDDKLTLKPEPYGYYGKKVLMCVDCKKSGKETELHICESRSLMVTCYDCLKIGKHGCIFKAGRDHVEHPKYYVERDKNNLRAVSHAVAVLPAAAWLLNYYRMA